MSSSNLNGLGTMAVTPGLTSQDSKAHSGSWFEAMARAWGKTMDQQADKIMNLSDQVSTDGEDKPSTMALLTAESLKMNFLANSESSSVDSVGRSLETMARKN